MSHTINGLRNTIKRKTREVHKEGFDILKSGTNRGMDHVALADRVQNPLIITFDHHLLNAKEFPLYYALSESRTEKRPLLCPTEDSGSVSCSPSSFQQGWDKGPRHYQGEIWDPKVTSHIASVVQQLSVVKTMNVTNYDDWICLTILKYTIEKNIRPSIPDKETAAEFLKAISGKYKKFEKSQKAYYLSLLDNTRYDGVSGVREHMMKLLNYNKLKGLKVDLGESYLVYRILDSLPAEYRVLRTSYNSQECEWSIDQMISIIVQEEDSQKKAKSLTQYVNNLTLGSSSKNGNEKGKEKSLIRRINLLGLRRMIFRLRVKVR
ncbi:casein kinase II subunit alpha-4, chloroplastic-like [Senna tora]|uniref:Casein kinase II subunit alpha-4, chloroplastic-like n=1 Tax=Senna tora TaxID=362788 RepID=A0A834VXG1_9FABA|nr:casein kinase II subunit alpha-4, chloroplastic-like [Senna tora]